MRVEAFICASAVHFWGLSPAQALEYFIEPGADREWRGLNPDGTEPPPIHPTVRTIQQMENELTPRDLRQFQELYLEYSQTLGDAASSLAYRARPIRGRYPNE